MSEMLMEEIEAYTMPLDKSQESEIPKGYKKTEVGIIPEDWEVRHLGDLGESYIGLTYSPNDLSYAGVLVLRSSNIQDGKLSFKDNVFVEMNIPSRAITKKGDILICARNGSRQLIGKCALIDDSADGMAFGAFMTIFRSPLNNYLFHQFQSKTIQDQIIEKMGATINQITSKDLSSFLVPLPKSSKEQTVIAKALSDVDTLINELEKQIAKKQAIKTATMQQLLTGRKRLPEFANNSDGTAKGYKQTELGEIPEDWEVEELGNLGKFKNGINKSADNFGYGSPFVNLLDVFGKTSITGIESLNLINSTNLEKKEYSLVEGDTLFIRSSVKPSGVGLTAVLLANLPQTVFSGFLIRYRTDDRLICNYKKYCFYENAFRQRIISGSTVSANTNINQYALKSILIAFPSSAKEQTAIAKILSDMDKDIQTTELRLAKTKQIKQGMMQELLTGKTRLPF